MPNARQRPPIPRNILILSFVALASGLGQDLITPALPLYLSFVGISHAGIGVIDGALQGAVNFARLFSGILSDRFGRRKPFVFFGYALSSVARPLLAFASSFASIFALRAIDGLGKGAKDAPRDALVAAAAATGERGRAFGFHRLVDTAGSVIGPLIASSLLLTLAPSTGSYRLIFILAAVPGMAALILIRWGVHETKTPADVPSRTSARLPAAFWLFVIASMIAMATKINDALMLLRGRDLGIPSPWIPALFAGFTLIYALCSYPIGILSDRYGRLPFIAAGWLAVAAVELGLARSPSLAASLACFALYGLFYALTEGSGRALIADLVPHAHRGSAYAVFYAATGVAVIFGGLALGTIWDTVSPQAAFGISAIGSFAAFLAFAILALPRVTKKKPLG